MGWALLLAFVVEVARGCLIPWPGPALVQPVDGAVGVPLDSLVRVELEYAGHGTVSGQLSSAAGQVIGLTLLDGPPKLRSFAPDAPLSPGTTYTVEVDFWEPFWEPWSFTTGDEAAADLEGAPEAELRAVHQYNPGLRRRNCEDFNSRTGSASFDVFPTSDPGGQSAVMAFLADEAGEPVGRAIAGALVVGDEPVFAGGMWSLSERLPRTTCFVVVQENAAGVVAEPSEPLCGRPERSQSCATVRAESWAGALGLLALGLRRRRR